MKKSLLDILFASEKRKNTMLLLKDGPQKMSFLLDSINTSRQALLPQIKILKERDLVYQLDDYYGLTSTGKLIADEMHPFMDTIETLDENSHYFAQHKVEGIPEHFLKRINEIKGFTLVEPSRVGSTELNSDYLIEALESGAVYFVYTFIHPTSFSILEQLVSKDIAISIILSKELFYKLIDEVYDTFRFTLTLKNVKVYVYEKDIEISSLTVIDTGFLLRLLFKNNEFSNKQVICSSPQGRKWGKELYDYYFKDAKPITEI